MATDEFFAAASLLSKASNYCDVFDETQPTAKSLQSRYRQLMKAVHPDRVGLEHRDTASDLTYQLHQFYETATKAFAAGQFGEAVVDLSFASAQARHTVTTPMSEFADMTNIYRAKTTPHSGGTLETIVKVARIPRDNDLLAAEAATVSALRSGSTEHVMFYPKLVDKFQTADGRKRLRVNVLEYMDGFVNLIEVKRKRPAGLNPLDAAWIWRRLLWALGGAHEQGVVHGAVLPQHVLIHPKMHGVVLVDWCYSLTQVDNKYPPLKAVVRASRAWYPSSVFAKTPVTEQLDVVMAARTMAYLLGGDPISMNMPGNVPELMRRYLVSISAGTSCAAYELLGQFDDVLKKLGTPYYPRQYRELKL